MTADDHKLKAAAMTDELGPPSPGGPVEVSRPSCGTHLVRVGVKVRVRG